MLPLDEKTIRRSFINLTRKEVTDLTLLPGLASLDWSRLDYFGWRDPKLPRRAYVISVLTDGPVGIGLTQTAASPRSRAQCSWCQDVTLPNDVALFNARRAGAAGRNGDTVGILVCDEFQCSANVRKLPPMAYIGFDAEAARIKRIDVLGERATAFATGMVDRT